jgi:hypothetical protein
MSTTETRSENDQPLPEAAPMAAPASASKYSVSEKHDSPPTNDRGMKSTKSSITKGLGKASVALTAFAAASSLLDGVPRSSKRKFINGTGDRQDSRWSNFANVVSTRNDALLGGLETISNTADKMSSRFESMFSNGVSAVELGITTAKDIAFSRHSTMSGNTKSRVEGRNNRAAGRNNNIGAHIDGTLNGTNNSVTEN